MYILFYFYILARDPCISMHEAKLSRARVDADNRRTEEGILRAAISSASFERISRPVHIHARSKLEPSKVIQRTIEQRQLFRTVISSVIFERHCSSEEGSSSKLERPCSSKAGSSNHFQRPCGSEAGSSSHFGRPSEDEAGSSNYFERLCGTEAGSSNHFERHCMRNCNACAAISSTLCEFAAPAHSFGINVQNCNACARILSNTQCRFAAPVHVSDRTAEPRHEAPRPQERMRRPRKRTRGCHTRV